MNIVLLGSPASGKGTQAEILCRDFGLYHLSTGDIARRLAAKDARIKEIIDSGKLVPHQTTIYVCMEKTCRIPVIDPEAALAQINGQFSI